MQKKYYFCSVKRKIGILFILFALLLGICSCQSSTWRGKRLQRTLHHQQHRANELLAHVSAAIEANNFDLSSLSKTKSGSVDIASNLGDINNAYSSYFFYLILILILKNKEIENQKC